MRSSEAGAALIFCLLFYQEKSKNKLYQEKSKIKQKYGT